MKRIYEDLAYVPPRHCWWWADVPSAPVVALTDDVRADVAVVGSGYTGLVTALELARAGLDVIVLDAERPGFGASTRNGGFCCLGGAKASGKQIRRMVGNSGLRDWRQTEIAAVQSVEMLLDRHDIIVDRHSSGETLIAHTPSAWRKMRADTEEIVSTYGFTPSYVPADGLRAEGLGGPFHGAMTLPVGFALNPGKYHAGLLRAALEAGVRVHGYSPVLDIKPAASAWRVHCKTGSVLANRVVIATNGYSSEDVPEWLRARYLPVQSSVMVTRPLTASELADQGWTSAQMAFDTRQLLHYFRLMPDGRFLFGMRGGLRALPHVETALKHQLRRHFEKMFPGFASAEATHVWSGLVCLTARLVPYVGPIPQMPGVFAGFGYHGNGVAMASHSGLILADLVQGRLPKAQWPKLMQQTPRRWPLGSMRRALLSPVYAWSQWRDQ
jgi:glycine/D-amino acid oxidase-like deaminating enzyme